MFADSVHAGYGSRKTERKTERINTGTLLNVSSRDFLIFIFHFLLIYSEDLSFLSLSADRPAFRDKGTNMIAHSKPQQFAADWALYTDPMNKRDFEKQQTPWRRENNSEDVDHD